MWTVLALGIACGGPTGDEDKGKEAAGAPVAPDPVTVVEVAEVTRGSVADVLVASAVVESEAQADLIPEATGVVREIRRDEGDEVSRGDVLAILDNVALGAGAERATAEVERLRQQVEEARGLLTRGAISVREVEDLEYQLRTAQVSSREASRNYGSTRITAPFDGVVAMRDVHVGELATSAKPAFRVVDPDRLRVVASVPERDLGRVAIAQPVRLVSAYDESVWSGGTVERMSPIVDASSGTFRVTVQVAEPDRLRPGQFVSVQIEVDRHEGVLVVPKKAVVYEDGVPVVYLVGPAPEEEAADGEEDEADDGGGSWWPFSSDAAAQEAPDEGEGDDATDDEGGPRLAAVRTYVELGLVDEEWAEIDEGVEEGDQVITVGQSHLRDGGLVRITEGREG